MGVGRGAVEDMVEAGRRRESGVRSQKKDRANSFSWTDRPVLVTGATGLLGSWLVKRLIELKAETVCLVRDWVPMSEAVQSGSLERVRVVRGDVRDRECVERVLGEYEIDTVFHLAAQTIVSIANRNPVSTFESNIAGTWSILEASRRSPTVKQIVVASSDKAYGDLDGREGAHPYEETMPLAGTHPYDVSKSCADLIAQSYAWTFNLPVTVTRCGNLYGGGDLNWNRVVPGTIRSVLRGERPIIRSDGKFIRDYFYVEDASLAVLLLAERMAADGDSLRGEAFNFSNERPMSVLDLIKLILNRMDSKARPVIQNAVQNEIRRQYLSSGKARRVLGWKSKITLEEGLDRTIAWYRTHFEENG